MTTIDATVMQQALEALELANRTSYSESNCIKFSEAIKSIRAAIAQPVQPAKPKSDKLLRAFLDAADKAGISALDFEGAQPVPPAEPLGQVVYYRNGRTEFYPWPEPPYLDNALDCKTVYAIAQPVQTESQWRDIATAPKDAYVLLWIDIVIGHPLVVQGCWFHDEDEDEKGWIDLNGEVLQASHWQPLPPAPAGVVS